MMMRTSRYFVLVKQVKQVLFVLAKQVSDDDERCDERCDEQTEHDVPSTIFSEDRSEYSTEESEGDGPEANLTRRRKVLD
jgi:hypothetical protein